MTSRIISQLIAVCVTAGLFGQSPQVFSEREPRYRLQPSDVLELRYRYTPEFNETVTIQPDGFAALSLVGALKLEGLSLDEARQKITEAANSRLRDPELSLILKDFQKPYFVVAGQVGHPGRFEMRGRVTAVEAITVAGGFTEKSKHSQVILYRRIGSNVAEAKLLNMKRIMTASGLTEDPELRPGDLLVVPQNVTSTIERFVKWGSFGIYFNPIAK